MIDHNDIRPNTTRSSVSITVSGLKADAQFINVVIPDPTRTLEFHYTIRGESHPANDGHTVFNVGNPIFNQVRPFHQIVPFLSRRKAPGYSYTVNSSVQNEVSGTLNNLSARVDLLATSGHFDHEAFKSAVLDIVGLPITTTSHPGGKQAGFFFDRETFIPIERMGEGVSEMVGLIVELCTERDRVFIIEEPEANLHPEALKALLNLVRTAAEHNQIIIATHSNVVLRELGDKAKLFRVYNDSTDVRAPSHVQEVGTDLISRSELLAELGYTFADYNLYEAWLFLEEASAERVIRDILIPQFIPKLQGRVRTFSSAGVNNMDRSLDDFTRLITFTHLEPVYQGKIWIMLDGDPAGLDTLEKIKKRFNGAFDNHALCFSEEQFERFYPSIFQEKVTNALSISDKQSRNAAKRDLLFEVLKWSADNTAQAKAAWAVSAAGPIQHLQKLAKDLTKPRTASKP